MNLFLGKMFQPLFVVDMVDRSDLDLSMQKSEGHSGNANNHVQFPIVPNSHQRRIFRVYAIFLRENKLVEWRVVCFACKYWNKRVSIGWIVFSLQTYEHIQVLQKFLDDL